MVQSQFGTVPQKTFSLTGVSTDHVRWSYGGPKASSKCRKFHRPVRQLSAAIAPLMQHASTAKGRGCNWKNNNTVGPPGVIAPQDSFYRIQIGSRVSEIRWPTPLFFLSDGLPDPFSM
jgi:hypothetical protein